MAGTLTKRQIASRAGFGFGLVREAYRQQPKIMSFQSSLYFAAVEGKNICKIGIAGNPFTRLPGIQTGCWLKLKLKALFWFPDIGDAAVVEASALKMARDEGVRLEGEWVALDWMEAVGLALSCPRGPQMKFTDSTGLVLDWLPELQRQRAEHEGDFIVRSLAKVGAFN